MGASRKRALAPRTQKVPLLIVYEDGVVPAADEVHTVLPVNGHPCHIPMHVALGQLLPSLDHGIHDRA